MPKFYFDVRDGSRFIPDEEGSNLADLAAAEREAAVAAAEIGRERLPQGELRTIVVEVRNHHGQRVLTATAALTVERVVPEPGPQLSD
ncbi:DUF6894 family protein [Terrihabitans rhizophilus]|uniref:DUF6894 family protein n=1 Tax=Terrihabitans rhizophilus TaxID=3092662 RepID=UPI003CC62027